MNDASRRRPAATSASGPIAASDAASRSACGSGAPSGANTSSACAETGSYAGRLALEIVATGSSSPAFTFSTFAPVSSAGGGCSPWGVGRGRIPSAIARDAGQDLLVNAVAEAALAAVEGVDEGDLALDLVEIGDVGQTLVVVPARLRRRR